MSEIGGKQITKELNFTKIMKDVVDKLVVVDFFAAWCTPCQRIIPELQELQSQFQAVAFFKVDVDENPDTAAAYQIKAVPTFVLFKNAVELDRTQGANTASLKRVIEKYSSSD